MHSDSQLDDRRIVLTEPERTFAKQGLLFGLVWPLLWFPLDRMIGGPLAAGAASAAAVALFHWLPPRVHPHITPGKSVAAVLGAGLTSALAIAVVERLF
jgi:hypothetical protein